MTRIASVLVALTTLFAVACHDDAKLCSGNQASLNGVPCCTQLIGNGNGGGSCQAGDYCIQSSDVSNNCICHDSRWICGDPPIYSHDMSVAVPPVDVDASTQD